MAKRKHSRKSGQHIEFAVPFSFEETRERLNSLSNQRLVLGHPQFYLQGYEGSLNIEDALIDSDTLEFRVWIKRYTLDVQMVGLLKRLTESETLMQGELHIGILNYATQLLILLFAVFVLTRSPLNQSFIIIAWLGFLGWFFWRMTHRYANKFARLFQDTLMDNTQHKKRSAKEKRKHA